MYTNSGSHTQNHFYVFLICTGTHVHVPVVLDKLSQALYKILCIHAYVNTSFVLQCMFVCLSLCCFKSACERLCPGLSIWPVELTHYCAFCMCANYCPGSYDAIPCYTYSTIQRTWEVFVIFYINNNILLK